MSMITIGKLARACDVKTDTVRYYEDKGLIRTTDRTESGYRLYAAEVISRLKFVRKAQSLGFTLKEIKEMLELSEKPEADCENVKQHAQQKIVEIDKRIADLTEMKKALLDLAKFCPGTGKPLSECNILQYFYSAT